MKIEFFSYKDLKTNSIKMDLLNKDLNVIATLDVRDFKAMKSEGLNTGILKDIVAYCNKYKGLSVNQFEPTVF